MGIARKWVFPILRIVIWALIAAALVKLAFFGGTDAASPVVPTGEVSEPQVQVETGTVRNDVVLDGTVAADPAVPARSTVAGEVVSVAAGVGQAVDAGTPLATVKGYQAGSTRVQTLTIGAPVAGTVSALSLLPGQQLAIGDVVGQVAPPTFTVSASLQPSQQYRLLTRPSEAQVAVTGGPAPFTCTGLTITTPLPGADPEAQQTPSAATLSCAVPADVTVFAGLAAKVTVAAGVAEDVLVVPVTAVEGNAQTGNVYLVGADGAAEPTPVTLGLTDGKVVEITGGVEEGATILEFVPGAEGGDGGDPGCVQIGPGSFACGG